MDLKVVHGKQVLEVTAPATATVAVLKQLLRPLTDGHVLERNMKLICKGKVLAPDGAQLSSFGISDGAKLMLLAGGSSGPSQPAARPAGPPRSMQLSTVSPAPTADQLGTRIARWAATGIVALRDAGLAALPEGVVEACAAATTLDLHRNCFARVPPQLHCFSKCTRLTLSACGLAELDCLALPTSLQMLNLDDNALTTLGPADALNRLTALRQLSVSRNALQQLPDIALPALMQIHAAHNQLQCLPAALHTCTALEELHLQHNHLAAVPASLGQLPRLKVLDLDSNRIKHFPPQVLQAPQLHTLALHDNVVIIEQLRELDGWAEFDARRRSRVDKQLAGGVLGTGGGLDEGSDAVMRRRHGGP